MHENELDLGSGTGQVMPLIYTGLLKPQVTTNRLRWRNTSVIRKIFNVHYMNFSNTYESMHFSSGIAAFTHYFQAILPNPVHAPQSHHFENEMGKEILYPTWFEFFCFILINWRKAKKSLVYKISRKRKYYTYIPKCVFSWLHETRPLI